MIDKKAIRKNPWRFILPAPILILLFSAFTFACIQPQANEVPSQIPADPATKTAPESVAKDTLKMKFIDPMAERLGEEIKWDKNSVIVVLMNRSSEVMIDNGETRVQDVEQKIISEYNKALEDKEVTQEIKVYVFRDIITDQDKFQTMLEEIGSALLKIRDMQSIKLYGNIYESLEQTEKSDIDERVPYRVYGTFPRVMATYDTRPKFKGEDEKEFMNYLVQNLEYPEALSKDSLKGQVNLLFILNADGSIGDVAIENSLHPLMDQEIIRVVKSSPTWTPAIKDGKPVPCTVEFPMSFVMQ